ncbi:MAG TPA: hypothetical protein VFE28_10920 [Candidatus Krumholzibacteria bacterium]|nr:hypothetical protein [Candidatus Krumholzibacteria bacterium]
MRRGSLALFGLMTGLVAAWGCLQSPTNNGPAEEPIDMAAFEKARAAAEAVVAGTGNGAPPGAHYNLNLIGVPKTKTADMSGNEGHRIFITLDGRTRILLGPGEYGVIDANGTDGTASFTLPNPDPDNNGITDYSVFARALGKPGGSGSMSTCATDPTTGEEWCSIYSMVMVRDKGKQTFENYSRELLYVFVDLDGDGIVDRVPLFDNRLQGYYWEYDNLGLKLVQLRFYEVPTDVTTP